MYKMIGFSACEPPNTNDNSTVRFEVVGMYGA